MSVRSAPLARTTLLTTASTTLATVPAGETWVLKRSNVYYPGGTAALLTVWARDPSADVTQLFINQTLSTGQILDLEHWLVLTPGNTLGAQGAVAGARIWLSGTRLIGVV